MKYQIINRISELGLIVLFIGCTEDQGFVEIKVDESVEKGAADATGELPAGSTGESPTSSEGGASQPDGSRPLRSESFTYHSKNKVDILWIVDNSQSMAEEQEALKANFQSFVKSIGTFSFDFQMAITSTSVCPTVQPTDKTQVLCPLEAASEALSHRGAFIGSPSRQILRKTDGDLIARFQDYVMIGITGSRFEHGLTAGRLSIDRSLSGQNDPLIRDGAFLAVIVVSDEEDDGIALSQTDTFSGLNYTTMGLTTHRYTHTDFLEYLTRVKGKGNFSVSAIAGTRLANGSLCSSETSQVNEEGTQYINAAKASGGIVESICSKDWGSTMLKIGSDIGTQAQQFVLKAAANPDLIRVYFNEVLTTHWTFDKDKNSVILDGTHLPADGLRVVISY